MHEEVKKHTKRIYETVKSTNHTFSAKLKEIIIEIFIIVFAVTLSIWLHSWSEHRHEQKEAKKFLIELREDLTHDIKLLKDNKQTSIRLDSNYKYILSLKKDQVNDTILGPYTDIISFTTNFNSGRYEGFKSSGKIGTIENDKLKNSILTYYQQTIPNLITEANFMNNEQIKILNTGQNELGNLSLNNFLTTKKMHSMLYFLEYNFRAATSNYDSTITQANAIIVDINKEASE
ncbi:MAG TPA: hypothetical protein VGP55_12755 [Chitinophagaceae bacterium]|nr:hypothetical protein [Chitinophagaceae bacterium]